MEKFSKEGNVIDYDDEYSDNIVRDSFAIMKQVWRFIAEISRF